MPSAVVAHSQRSRLLVAGSFGLLAMLGLAVGAAIAYTSTLRRIDHAKEVQREIDDWVLAWGDAQSAVRGYVATGRSEFLAQGAHNPGQHRASMESLQRLVVDNPTQRQAVTAAARQAEAVRQHLEQQVLRVRAGQRDEALAILGSGAGMRLMAEFRRETARVRDEESRLLRQRQEHAAARGAATVFGSGVFALASLVLLSFAWQSHKRHEQALARLATEARARLRLLAELGEGLASSRSVAQVTDEIVTRGRASANGDTCTLYVANAAGNALDLVGATGVAPEVLSQLQRISVSDTNPTFLSFGSGRSIWVENEADYARLYPKLAKIKATGTRAKAFWSVPLLAEGRALGLLGVGFYTERRFSQDERAFIETLAHQCAQALLRASRLEREDEARRWLGTTLRSIGDAVIATDVAGVVTFMNPIAERLTGWSEAEALGQPLEAVFRIVAEATREPMESPVARVLREGKVVGLANHTVLQPKTGPELPIDDSGAPIINEQGTMVGVVLVFRDVTQEKRSEARNEFLARAGEALASSLEYQTTLATVARFAVPQLADWCGVDLVDAEAGRPRQVAVAHVDPNKVKLAVELGQRYPPAPNAVRGVPQVVRTGKSELYPDIPPELLEAGAQDAEHLRMLRELSLTSAMVVPLRARGRTFGAMSFVYAGGERRYDEADLAFAEELARRAALAIENSLALKEAEEARARERWLRDEAERANRAKDEFLATVSHELRTPLNAILGWTVALRARQPPETIDKALAIVERNARAQAKLIEDVLDVSRIISGKLSLSLGPANLALATRAAIETVMPAAEAKRISLEADVKEGDASTITADANRLQQIVWNLLSNAVKFTPIGGRVSLRVFRDASDVCLDVTDNGEGIHPEEIGRIFEAFHQADSSSTRRHGGLGLGLSIVKELVLAHGGSVRAKSDGPGKGSTFSVRLPVHGQAAARGAEVPLPCANAPAVPEEGREIRLDGLKVLVVDDEPDALAVLDEVLRSRGAHVTMASSAAAALAALAEVRPDVIVSDIGMPIEDGYTLIKRVRALPIGEGGRTPAVALTAYARPEDAQRAFSAGFQVHVTKPLEPARLALVVANLGGRSL